jgi:hypothetical protein
MTRDFNLDEKKSRSDFEETKNLEYVQTHRDKDISQFISYPHNQSEVQYSDQQDEKPIPRCREVEI